MDIPKIYVAGEKKRVMFSADLPDKPEPSGQVPAADVTYELERPCAEESGGESTKPGSRAGGVITAALTVFFCAVTAIVVAVMLINSGKSAATAIAALMNSEIYGGGPFQFQSPTAPSSAGDTPDTGHDETTGYPADENTDSAETDPPEIQTDAPSETSPVPVEETDVPSGENAQSHPIARLSLGAPADDLLGLQNETKYTPDMAAIAKKSLPTATLADIQSQYGNTAPAVLIIHTHGTESYSPDEADSLGDDAVFRSENTDENVVAVGRVMAETLSRCGVGVLHSTVMYDKDDYKSAYDASAAAVRDYMKNYPSIRYIFDVHRDSITRSDGTAVSPVTELYGKSSAQVMLVAGTDEGGAAEYDWSRNLTLAALIQNKLGEQFPGLSRRINLRRAAFNQGIAPGYLLIEVGSHATSLAEAKRGAAAAAVAIAEVIGADISKVDAAGLISSAE